ncbi:NAD(P)/FAD-dependent oxidoreductase [Tsuneonella sp. CC-YZS046]|uniref:flavin-containing monooxygenase n=1 Tax=Tsuneonella sp. CC-YZS046 TaxID=3042152 RepID=UPI002D79F1FA|nr:NAD(P)/FAD-dependent oxidoreductase [Tsuneonella sp. CC-YZS046]WRO67236.1 NAD(P)/FAD-dependent oxidoreductase [Tsuneonella sp. CC-YZS046]
MSNNDERTFDVIIIGTGFAGVYGLYRMREAGFNVLAVEAGDDVGGCWYWNRYPGLRCDVDSLEYAYAFSEELQKEWRWSERYAKQNEIQGYISFAADRLNLRKDIRFNTRVKAATFDNAANRWTLETENGDRLQARYVVMATGCLSVPNKPNIPGIENFGGQLIHSVQWPKEKLDLSDKNVAVIGTGSTGIQMIPLLAQEAKHLTVVQRTPAFCVPARNQEWNDARIEYWRENYRELRDMARNTRAGVLHEYGLLPAAAVRPEDRKADLERRWLKGGPNVLYGFSDLLRNEETNELVSEFLRGKIAEAVKDPETARKLMPYEYPVGAKRVCVGTDYYETYNRDNVSLIDLRSEKLQQIEKDGIRTEQGFYPVDVLILATGYDAMTGALLAIDIRTTAGKSLREQWSHGPQTYLGLGIAGFPNMFVVTGPGSPSVFSNMVLSVEHDMDWIAECLDYLRERGFPAIEADAEAQEAWMDHVDQLARGTLVNKAASWYRGANVEGKPQKFMPYLGGVNTYQAKCRDVADQGYEGFLIGGEAQASQPKREMADG